MFSNGSLPCSQKITKEGRRENDKRQRKQIYKI